MNVRVRPAPRREGSGQTAARNLGRLGRRVARTSILALLLPVATAADGSLTVRRDGPNALLQVQGDTDDEWRFQSSGDLLAWTEAPALGTVFSLGAPARTATADATDGPQRFYRAVRTSGLYDPGWVRTISLTFTQSNWQALLTNGRTTGSNTACTVVFDNGVTNASAGARYKGNSSFTGMGGSAPIKKSVNLEFDFTDPTGRAMGYKTLNLNNAYGDETVMREPLYFNVMRRYTVCPRATFAKLYINGAYWGLYSAAQQQDGDLVDEWFPSHDGDRWRAPNMGGGTGGPGGGGGFSGSGSALSYLGTNVASYTRNYELKSDNSTNAWLRLVRACQVLNTTPAAALKDQVDTVLAVDRWLWFLALENLFGDEDSYYFKGADYMFYYEPESGRIHPIEHDGNESLQPTDVSLSPVQGATGTNRPVLKQLLSVPEWRQRYLAHLRTVLEESFNPATLTPLIDQFHALTVADVLADPKKGYTMAAYTNDLNALRTFVTNRYRFLTNHAELRPLPPDILAVTGPVATTLSAPGHPPVVTAHVQARSPEGLDSVWLYHRGKSYGPFAAVPMLDDGAHDDGAAGDGVFGAAIAHYAARTKVRYYVEARSANTAKAARFAPARAEQEFYSYRAPIQLATNSPVAINEFMAANRQTLADPQGEYDDWIELRNLTADTVDLTGRYLTDDPDTPRKWPFPEGTTLPPHGFLLVWADEDTLDTPGLHANFRLAADGEQLLLIDTDANLNAALDAVTFGAQTADRAYGRPASAPDTFVVLPPTPGQANP